MSISTLTERIRCMGDSEESSFSKITSDFILVFMLMTDLGIEWNGVGQIAQHRLQADFQDYFLVYFNKVISTRIILALIAFGVIVITCVFLEIARMHAMLFIGFGLSVLISDFLAEWVLVGIGAFRLLVLYRIIRSLLYLGMTVFLITGPTALWKAGFVYTFSLFAESIGILYFLKKTYKWKCTVPKRETGAIKFIAESLPYFTYTLLSQIFFIVCILLARYIADDNATGLYSAAYRVISLVIPLGVYFVSAIYPHVLSATADKVQELFSMFFLRMIVLSVPISISFIALSE